jgi:hypothetical protein
LGNELLDFDADYIRKKFISYGQRLSSLTISAGDTMSKLDFEETWNPCKKLCEEVIYTLPVIRSLDKFEMLLNWQFEFRNYNSLSLDHFSKGGFFDESNKALINDALRRAQEVMAIVFGDPFRDVFTKYIQDIMDKHNHYEGGYLRYMVEEVLYRYGQLMSDIWTTPLATFYNVTNLHEAGNAAKLLNIMVDRIVPSFPLQQEYLRSVTNRVIRNTSIGSPILSVKKPSTSIPTKKKKITSMTSAAKIISSSSTPSRRSLCLKHLKFKLGISTVDCTKFQDTGIQCRNVHRTPDKGNKRELQHILGHKNHHGSPKEKGEIHDELKKL